VLAEHDTGQADRARLEAAIPKGRQEIADGKWIPAEQIVAELWAAQCRETLGV